jgi:hypothetical protein
VNRRRIRLLSYAVAFAVILLLPTSCRKQTSHTTQPPTQTPRTSKPFTITVEGVNGAQNGGKVSYPDLPPFDTTRCDRPPDMPPQQLGGDIYVCPGDTVVWKGRTDGNVHKLTIIVPDNILGSTTFSETNGQDTSPTGTVKPGSPGKHKYYVALGDTNPAHPYLYIDDRDPIIIVGGK